ncbi:hypothetical protein C6Q07_25245 [Burkholderia multivorans]|nr:hypothetical protein C6Q07_25245 [Burkholderia multivorans]
MSTVRASMNGSAASRQNGDGIVDERTVRRTRRAPGANDECTPYKTASHRASGAHRFAAGARGFA